MRRLTTIRERFGRWWHAKSLAAQKPRRIRINAEKHKFAGNLISTTKYNPITFLPKFLFEQFQKFFNIFFLAIVGLQQIPNISPTGRWTMLLPLSTILAFSGLKEIIEDIKRWRADGGINRNRVKLLINGKWCYKRWQDVKVGNIVKIKNNTFFPADIVLLSSSEPQAMAYIETSNLDGETNLKFRLGHPLTARLNNKTDLFNLEADLEFEQPDQHLYEFHGRIIYDNECVVPLGPEQLLLRGSKLKNTEIAYGVVIYTGRETRMALNSRKVRSKRSNVDHVLNMQILIIIGILFSMALISSIIAQWQEFTFVSENQYHWYLHDRVDNKKTNAAMTFVLNMFTFIISYNTLVPISLLVTLEFVRLIQAAFMNCDVDMYYEPTDTRAVAKTSGLNEELGQVKYLLTDKTGTLTQNVMVFKKCSVAGHIYTDDSIKHFTDKRIVQALNDPKMEPDIRNFLIMMSACHTVVPEKLQDGNIEYQASSPDELALIRAAASMGFEFRARTPTTVTISVNDVDEKYRILNVIEFSSARKRMSVIMKCPDGRILLYTKGSDSVIFERLNAEERNKAVTDVHLKIFAEAGYRTLCFAMTELSKSVYEQWNLEYLRAAEASDHAAAREEVAEKIEQNMTLLGATAIEDKLQEGVPDTIEALLKADIKIWMLTGDKQETAVNIGRSCKLICPGTEILIVNRSTYEGTNECICGYVHDFGSRLGKDNDFALIIDGLSLKFALLGETRNKLAELALSCRVVICCRVSPVQKAQVVDLVKQSVGAITLAVGDGGNDVAMIQAAHVGVGIYGQEGLQAACASDYSIAQFRFLKKLLFVHGAWNFHRQVKLILYSYYKNACLYVIPLYFALGSGWSGTGPFERWAQANYNLLFAALSPLAIGLFDRTATAETQLKYPELYKLSQDKEAFSVKTFWVWLLFAVLHSLTAYIIAYHGIATTDMIGPNAGASGMYTFGMIVYGYIIVTINIKAGLEIETWTWPVHVAIWFSIIAYFIYVIIDSYFWPIIPVTVEMSGMIEFIGSNTAFWFGFILTPVAAIFPDAVFKVFRRTFYRTTADKVRTIEWLKSDPGYVIPKRLVEFGRSIMLRRSPSVAKITEEANRGFAFSQDEEGALTQGELIRVDRTPHSENQQTSMNGEEKNLSSEKTQSIEEESTQPSIDTSDTRLVSVTAGNT